MHRSFHRWLLGCLTLFSISACEVATQGSLPRNESSSSTPLAEESRAPSPVHEDLPAVQDTEQVSLHLQPDHDLNSAMLQLHVFDRSGKLVGPVAVQKIVRTAEEWRALLTPEQFRIARASGTERPFCGTLLDNKESGVYSCICCDLPLFSSESKFHSGTGWPSFFRAIAPGNVAEKTDRSHGMIRVEINCARCDGHLGHVFEDGPPPTGLRYCLNSESLRFVRAEDTARLADPAAEAAVATGMGGPSRLVLGGGCFWCVEAVFEELEGVEEAISGYAGGTAETANYKAVCSGETGHAEAVEILYDSNKISYVELLEVHFATHDPTSLNRQGADVGTQYRSVIFYSTPQERELAEAFLADVRSAGTFARPIVTTLEPLSAFYPAEIYHQNYVCQNPGQGYVRGVALPKVDKVRKKFADKLKQKSPLE